MMQMQVYRSGFFFFFLGFHNCSQEQYLSMIKAYASYFKITIKDTELEANAISWAAGRGSRSGRVAWQFITDLASKNNISIY